MSSTPEQNKARRIRLQIESEGLEKVAPAKISWLKDYESRVIPRRPPKVTVSNTLPKPEPPSATTSASATPSQTGAAATPPTGESLPNSPPPLNASQPAANSAAQASSTGTTVASSSKSAPSATPSAPTVKFDANYKPGPIGEQLGGLWLGYIRGQNAAIEKRGGKPYPDQLAVLGSLSTAYLADKYLAGYLGDDAIHALNSAVPVAWVLWEEHKLDKRDADPIETTATDKPAETKATAAAPPKPSPKAPAPQGSAQHVANPLNGTHANPPPSREEQETIAAAMGG